MSCRSMVLWADTYIQTWPNYYINNTALYVWVMIANQLYLTLSSADKCMVNEAHQNLYTYIGAGDLIFIINWQWGK